MVYFVMLYNHNNKSKENKQQNNLFIVLIREYKAQALKFNTSFLLPITYKNLS